MEWNAASMGKYGASWECRSYFGSGNVQPLLDSLAGRRAVVCGNAKGVFEDVDKILLKEDVVFAANDVGMYLPRLDHWCTLHYMKLPHWTAIRNDAFSRQIGNVDYKTHSHGSDLAHFDWFGLTPIMPLSGLFAAQVAYLMGCDPIILVGCPNDQTPRFFETTPVEAYVTVQKTIKSEMAFKPDFKKAIRSVSGWTKEYFGQP